MTYPRVLTLDVSRNGRRAMLTVVVSVREDVS
jgi:hypothetical protein